MLLTRAALIGEKPPVGCTVDATGFHADAAGGVGDGDGDEGSPVVLRDGDFLRDGVAPVAAAR